MSTSLPSTMRAAQWSSAVGGIEKNLRINENAALPKKAKNLPKDSTLVKIAYASPNPVDYKIAELPFIGSLIISAPGTPGLDFSGTVETTNLAHLKPGEPVFGKLEPPAFGTFCDYAVVGKQGCVPVPQGVKLEHAACVGVAGLASYQSIKPFVKAGDKIFINGGSGGTGTFGIQIAKALGCYVVTSCSGANVQLCSDLGADEVVDYKTSPVIDTLKSKGMQYDHVVDNVGGDFSLYFNCHHYLKPEGRYVTIAGDATLSGVYNAMTMMLLPAMLGGGQRKVQFVTANSKADDYAQIAVWMAEGKVKAVIEESFALQAAGKAFERLKTGRTRGKLVIKIADNEI